jgi:hypothetical protein
MEFWQTHNAKLVPEQKQFGFRLPNAQPYVDDVEQ